MDTPSAPLFNAFMQDLAKQLVPLIVAEFKHQTNAEGMGMIALDPDNIALPVYTVIKQDHSVRALILELIEEHTDDTLSDLARSIDRVDSKVEELDSKFEDIDVDDLKGEIATLEEKVGELEENRGVPVDADDSDFQDVIRSVLRNHII